MKRYLITGASRGIGRAIAEQLAAPDIFLFLHGRDEKALALVAQLVRAKGAETLCLMADLRDHDAVERLADEVQASPLDVLINNAGFAVVKPFDQISLEEWNALLSVNVTAPFLLTRRLAPRMASGSAIVNVLSIAAKTGFANWSGYCMTKFALEGWSQSLREELRARSIRVLNVYPAATNTEIWNGVTGEWPREKMMVAGEIASAIGYALSRPADVALENITLSSVRGTL
ncbi:MAG: SDR family oxidoreductase [Chthoniobacterales bacterium]